MIIPAIIAPSIQGYSISNNIVGEFAFAHGGAWYAFLHQGGQANIDSVDVFGDFKIHALKSTDSGATWIEQDAAGAITPDICVGFADPAYTVAVDGNTVYVISLRIHAVEPGGTGIDGITVTSFNLASGLWGSPVDYSTPLPGPWTYSGSAMVVLQLVVRGSGDYLLYFSGPLETVGGGGYGRVYYAPFNGASFGSAVMLPSQTGNTVNYSAIGAVCGSSGITQFVFFPFGPNVYSVGLAADGSFGSVQTVTTASYLFGTNYSMPRLYTVGGSESALLFGWIDDNNDPDYTQSLRGFHAPLVLNPTWLETYICLATNDTDHFTGPYFTPTHSPCNQTFSIFCKLYALSISGTRAVAIWAVTKQLTETPETTIGEFWFCEADTSTFTWTSPEVLFQSSFPGVQPFPDDPDREAYLSAATQVLSFDAGSGGIGVIGFSLDQALAQASESGFIPGTATGPTLDCGSPPDGVVGVSYEHTLDNTHAGSVFSIAITDGALPDGLEMDSSGEITGTPTTPGDFDFTATIIDEAGTGSVDCTITINAPTIGLGCANPPDGVVGVEFHHTFPVSGGTPPYTFAIIDGILPPGLTLDSLTGEVSGTPTLPGEYVFTIQASDGAGSTVGTCEITITVTVLPEADITCDSPPAGEVGLPYAHTFPVTDIPEGATVSYAITAGTLPPGLTLDPDTGEVTGTPTTSGHYSFTITLTVVELEGDFLTDIAGRVIYTTGGDRIFVTFGVEGL